MGAMLKTYILSYPNGRKISQDTKMTSQTKAYIIKIMV